MTNGVGSRTARPRTGDFVVGLAMAVLSAGCSGRAVGTVRDGGPGGDARPDGSADGGVDASGRPDGSWDGGPGCVVPEDPVIIHNETSPAFVHSLDRVGDRFYVLGGSEGWQDMQASLWLLDGDTLEPLHRHSVNAEIVFAAHDPHNAEIVAVTDNDSALQFLRYTVSTDGSLVTADQRFLCDDCAAAWQGPVVGLYHAAVAVRHYATDELQVFILPRGMPGVTATQPVSGGTPRLFADSDGPVMVYYREQLLRYLPFYWTGERIHDPQTVSNDPVTAVLAVRAGWSNHTWVAVLNVPQESGVVRLYNALSGQQPGWFSEVPDVMGYSQYCALSDNGDTVAMAWGETFGQDRVGAHFMAFSIAGTQLIFGPRLVSAPINHSPASYSVWAATAPHPEGHAVVWGAWQEQTFHGIYGKIIRCRSIASTPP